MSYRTLVELNHDYCPTDEKLLEWAKAMVLYMRSGDQKLLPKGVTWKDMRHHSDPEFFVKVDTSVIEFVCERCGLLLHRGNAQDWMDINDSTICPKAIIGLSHKAVPRRTSGN